MLTFVFAFALMQQTAVSAKPTAPSKQWSSVPMPMDRHSGKPLDPAPWVVNMRLSTLFGTPIGYYDQIHKGGAFEAVCSAGAPLKTFAAETEAKAYVEACAIPK